MKLYREILSKNGDHVPALNNLAAVLTDGKGLDEALNLSRKAAALAPEMDRFWILMDGS